ncbi:MAG: LysM peptidoglycan-binding domain-containing protein [Myxococcales bacterium FL481]|nr:MAG: LysM peptidoglycan-binding domain-containing protein [Myxococcales bacterium FL481]
MSSSSVRSWSFLSLASFAAFNLVPAVVHAEPPAPTAAAAAPRSMDYTVQPGDTCIGIATRFLGDGKLYPQIHELNPDLGPTPHKLAPGSVLRLPVIDPRPDAQVTEVVREVQAREHAGNHWQRAERGFDLYRGWHVSTLEEALAQLTFRDDSRLEMRENTLVIIYGETRTRASEQRRETRLERGSLRTRLGELAGETPALSVTTPTAYASMGRGSTLVKVDEAGTSRFANHGDGVTSVRSNERRGEVKLRRGEGSKVRRGKSPTPAKALPSPPQWAGGPNAFVGASGLVGTIAGTWEPVADAGAYQVEVMRDTEPGSVVASVRVHADTRRYQVHGLPMGRYRVTVATIDRDEMESVPSAPRQQTLHDLRMESPGSKQRRAPSGQGLPARVQALPGTVLYAPPSMTCRLGDSAWASQLVATEPGVSAVECRHGSGASAPGFLLEVVSVAPPQTRGSFTTIVTGVRGTEGTHVLVLDSPLPLGETLHASASPGVRMASVSALDPGRWELRFTTLATAKPTERIELRLSSDPETAPIGSVVVAVSSPVPRPRPPAPAPAGPTFTLGAYVGGLMIPQRHELYEKALVVRPTYRVINPEFALRVGVRPLNWLAVRLAMSLSRARFANDEPASLFGGSFGVFARLPRRVSPFVGAGASLLTLDSSSSTAAGKDTDLGPRIAAGLGWAISPRFAIEAEVASRLLFDHSTIFPLWSAGLTGQLVFGPN